MAHPDVFDGLSEFLAVAERASFRAAAADIGVTPAAVSQTIQSLERRLGLPLFHRTTRKVALTEAGALLFARLRARSSERSKISACCAHSRRACFVFACTGSPCRW